jgi:glycine cleavage system H lipoate-binding protein
MVYRIGLMTDQVKGAFNLKDPYGEGWIFEMKMSDSAQLANLMKGEIAKHAKKKK